jgi:hypothetical protein
MPAKKPNNNTCYSTHALVVHTQENTQTPPTHTRTHTHTHTHTSHLHVSHRATSQSSSSTRQGRPWALLHLLLPHGIAVSVFCVCVSVCLCGACPRQHELFLLQHSPSRADCCLSLIPLGFMRNHHNTRQSPRPSLSLRARSLLLGTCATGSKERVRACACV